MTLTKELIKGSPSYSVTDSDGTVVAYAHCAHVKLQRFTLVIGGKFSGLGSEAQVVSLLEKIAG